VLFTIQALYSKPNYGSTVLETPTIAVIPAVFLAALSASGPQVHHQPDKQEKYYGAKKCEANYLQEYVPRLWLHC